MIKEFDEDEEWFFDTLIPQCVVHKVILFIPHAGSFTGLGYTREEATEVARLKYLGKEEHNGS